MSLRNLPKRFVVNSVLHLTSETAPMFVVLLSLQEWMVDGISTEQHVKYYACCSEPYPDVTFTIHMRRGSLFYVVNLIAPCFLIFLISFLGFFLPVESGDKVNLETTILLALVVFLLMVGETMPPTPDAIPILGKLQYNYTDVNAA
jgi:nicotinic acetylcholine receptor, invertebrate